MSEQRDLPRTLSTSIPAITTPAPLGPSAAWDDEARARIDALEREARALGATPAAALLFHEMGLLWESPLRHPRNAAVAYQSAFRLAPRFLANIRAARRLFAEVGNWVMVVQLIDAEIQGTDAPRTKAALLFEKGQVLEQRLSQEAEGTSAIAQCLALEPQDVTLLVQLEATFCEKGDFPALVRVYQLLALNVREDATRAAYLTTAGLLLEDRLKDPAQAAKLFRAAFAIDRRDPQLLSAIKRVAQREGTLDEELAALAAEAEGQGTAAAPTFLRISKTYERLGRPEDALAALLAARRVSPADPLVLSELARIYEAQGRGNELADVLRAWAEVNADESEFVAINLRLSALYEQLRRDTDAVGRYHAILTRVPGHAGALAGLGKLYYHLENWQGLYETYEAEADATEDPRLKAARLYKAGETLEERLSQVEEAITRYQSCLHHVPGFLPAQKALTRLFEKLGRWTDLIGMYDQDLLQTPDKEHQVTLLNKIAALYEDRLDEPARAIECLKRVQDLAPDHLPTLRNLGRLYERCGRWPEILELNEDETRLAADTKQVVSIAHRSAEILEEQIKDRPAAIAAWERVLQLSPNYLPALRALGRLYGQDGRWPALVKMYRTEAELATSPAHAAAIAQRIGELYEEKVGDGELAVGAYREVLALAPNHLPALRALARLYRAQGDWANLIEVLRAEGSSRTDPNERANALFQAAGIWEDQLGDAAHAVEGYQDVLRLVPTHATALQQLERLLITRDDVRELISLFDRQTQAGPPAGRVTAWLNLARLYLDRLNEPARAATCCESALALDPASLTALRLLERIRAHDKPRRAELRARVAAVVGDARLATAIRLAAGDPLDAGSSGGSLEELKGAFRDDPTDETLGLLLERGLQKVGDARGLIELYERRRATAADSFDQLQLLLRSAELHESKTQDFAAALKAYEQALEAAPGLFPALMGQSRCAAKLGNTALARAALVAVAKSAHEPATGTQALLDAAVLARDVEHDELAAAELFRQVLGREPLHHEAGAALEELLAKRGGSEDLVALHQSRAAAKLAQNDPAAAAAQYLEAAQRVLDALGDRPRAMALLDQALQAAPTHLEALELKGRLAVESQSYAEAAAAWAVRVQLGGEPQQLARLHLRLGAMYHEQLGDPAKAAAHLQSAIAGDPSSVEALERLAVIHGNSKNYTGAADCLRRLLELEPQTPAKARNTLALARISDEGFNDVGQAIILYRQVLDLVPGEPVALDRLVLLYERTGALADLLAVLERQAQTASDVKKAVAIKTRIATIQGKSLTEPLRAVSTWKEIIEVDPTNVPAHAALADLFGRDSASLGLAIEAHRNLLRLEPTRVESLHALFRMWESLRQLDKAFCVAAQLTFLKSANETETAFFTEGRNRLPTEYRGGLGTADLEDLHHPWARGPLLDVLRAIGDQFSKLFPPQLELNGIDKKTDRLKGDHALARAFGTVASLLGAAEHEVYQSRRGLLILETTDPLSVCIGSDVVRRFNLREQRFLYGRAGLGLHDKAALLRRVSPGELADILGNTVRIHQPDFDGLGRRNEDQTKQLRRAYSRKALKLLEEPADAVASSGKLAIEPLVLALGFSFDRAGLLACGDVGAGLALLLREEGAAQPKSESAEAVADAVGLRPDVRELMAFGLSDDFFRLRQRIGVSLG